MKNALLKMSKLGFSASKLITSPFLRARQTATLIEQTFPSLKANVESNLASGNPLNVLKKVLTTHAAEPALWAVGHMPDMAILGSRVAMEAYIIERGLQPGEILALEANLSGPEWEVGKVLWFRSIEDWEKVTSL